MSDELTNYAEEPAFVTRNRRRNRRRTRISIVLLIIAALMLFAGIYLIHGANEDLQHVNSLAEVAHAASTSDEGSDDVNWDAVQEATSNRVGMWINVPSRDIDFAVAQWDDNEYGLHHDIYGDESWAGVFLDCDADPNGLNKIIYGHTLYSGGMFSGLAASRYQDEFDTIGTIRYATPERGWREYTPVMSLDVDPDDAFIRTFDFAPDSDAYELETKLLLASKKAAGVSNMTLPVSVSATDASSVSYLESVDPLQSIHVSANSYYVLTDADKKACEEKARKASFRDWLSSIAPRADAIAPNSADLIAQADDCVVLACCSWPFHNARTLVIAVASD